MLRLRQHTWGVYLFDLWVVCFTALVFYALWQSRETSNDNKALIQKVERTTVVNRGLIRQVSTFSRRTDNRICIRINNINFIITATLRRSKRNVPKLAYYKTHSDELKAVLKEIDREIYQFRPRKCKSNGRGGE